MTSQESTLTTIRLACVPPEGLCSLGPYLKYLAIKQEMVYHCTIPLESDSGRPSALCGIAILPLRTKVLLPSETVDKEIHCAQQTFRVGGILNHRK